MGHFRTSSFQLVNDLPALLREKIKRNEPNPWVSPARLRCLARGNNDFRPGRGSQSSFSFLVCDKKTTIHVLAFE